MMNIIGYSERGMLNSLFYEIYYKQLYDPRYAHDKCQLFKDFFSLIRFPFRKNIFNLRDFTFLIEQSFSDFGDADLVLLMDNDGKKQTVFIEAKVKTNRQRPWLISDEFDRFKDGIAKKEVSSSNLFTQLYHKMRLFNTLKRSGIGGLQTGVEFPKCSSKGTRKIGSNEIVIKAVNKIEEFSKDAFYIVLIPDRSENVEKFFQKKLVQFEPPDFIEWDVKNWGYITWEKIENFCSENSLNDTLGVFKHNQGQIY